MTGPLVAPELLAALPDSWQVAEPAGGGQAVDEARPADPEQRAVALTALEACLADLADLTARYGEE